MVNDLRDWIETVEKMGELARIHGASELGEIGALSALNYRRPVPAALLFDEIPGYPAGHRVLTGSLSNARRMGLALRLGQEVNDRELVEVLRGRPTTWAEQAADYPTVEVGAAPFEKNHVDSKDADLSIFPSPLWHENDGGPYLGTGNICITSDPDTGAINGGTCRMQVHDGGQLTVKAERGHDTARNIDRWFKKQGRAPIAVSFGHDPLLLLVGGTEVPSGISELEYAGAVIGKPLEVVAGPQTGLPIPASAEIVIEGWLVEGETLQEGPFGEWRGYYSESEQVQAVQIANLYYRDDPIILGSPPGKPPYDYSYMRSVLKSAMIHDALERAGVPGVTGVWPHEAGGGRMFIAVAIKQQYVGHSRQAAYITTQCREGVYMNRFVVVVDDDIDPRNLDEVVWAMCTRSDPAIDIEVLQKTWGSPGDPMRSDPSAAYMSRAIIDACRPYGQLASFPAVADHSRELMASVEARWGATLNGLGR